MNKNSQKVKEGTENLIIIVGLPFWFSCKWKKKIMGDNFSYFKQLKSLHIQHIPVQYYQYTCYCIHLTKKSNSFMCTWTSSIWVMEHFAVLHHVVLCTFFYVIYKFINFHPIPLKWVIASLKKPPVLFHEIPVWVL